MANSGTQFSNTILDAAREYISLGISVIPLHGPEEPAGQPVDKRGKRPAIASWKEFQSRIATDDELVNWFESGKRNIGIVTGAITGFTIVDFDTKAAIAYAKAKGFPRCPVVNTGKGLHAYCKYEAGQRNFQKRADLPGVDLRAEGGYVVAPPSIHATGVVYQWKTGCGLELSVPHAPEWLFTRNSSDKASNKELYTCTPEGRNISLTRLAGIWIHQNMGIDLKGLTEMGLVWSTGLSSPLPPEEVERTCKSIYDRHHVGESEHLIQWPAPLDIETKLKSVPYPIDALPESVVLAVKEVLGFVKAPVPLVAAAALSALSIAIQPHADVERAVKLSGPSSLFLLTIAESGERKSTCDGFFSKSIREYESAQAEVAKPSIKIYEANLAAWDSKYNGVKDSIRQMSKSGKPTVDQESLLRQLQDTKPESPRVPRIIYGDTTPEALKYNLAKQWPSAAVVSSEGGIVFGSHGMGKDSAMRNLATLNQFWDGTDMPTERRSSESFTVRGARLTMSLMVQEATLRAFFKQDGGLARGTGFLARFLIAWPESTQGFRPFTEAPENWPHLAEFNKRLAAILNQPAPIDDDGALAPVMLSLTPEAKAAWVGYHDAIESELATGGELFDIRDVASKIADNAARLACQFHVFSGASGAIGLEAFESASRITAWHLSEARRFFGGLALPQELADAARLDSWLICYCRREKVAEVPVSKIQQYGPCGLRSKNLIDAAMEELEGLERSRRVKDGKRRTIHINPVLLAGDL